MVGVIKSLNLEVKSLRAEVGELHGKLSSMRAGDVLTVGTQQSPDAITDTVHAQYYRQSTKLNNVLQDASKRSW
jgi:hypothetical protein